MRSIKAYLKENREEFLKKAGLWGDWEAMRKYGIKPSGYVTVREFIIEETGDENYGLYPELTSLDGSGGNNPLKVIIKEFTNFVAKTAIRDKEKDRIIAELKEEIRLYQQQWDMDSIQDEMATVIEACRT